MKLTDETFVLKILKLIEIKSLEHNAKLVELTINDKIEKHITDHYDKVVKYFEKKYIHKGKKFKHKKCEFVQYTVPMLVQ